MNVVLPTFQTVDTPLLRGRPLHKDMNAACVLEKAWETKIMHIITKVWGGEFYENIYPTFLFIVSADTSIEI
jgi:hypothetical protein